jgi:DNA-binding transcriptional regulator WhiA
MRSDIWNPTVDIAKKVIQDYKSGISARQLGFKNNVADVTVTDFLKRNNIFIRNRSNAKRTNQINETIFDEINEESAYWIGFILSDGNIYYPKNRSKQLNFGLKESDWEHLEKFKKFIGSDKPLYRNNNSVFVSFYSNKIVDKLEEYGITQRKSNTAKVPEQLKNNIHFWRGMIDGDGWVSNNIGICGTLDVVNNFKNFIKTKNKVCIKQENFGEIKIYGKLASDICYLLYNNSNIYLDRKFANAKDLCSKYNLCINN